MRPLSLSQYPALKGTLPFCLGVYSALVNYPLHRLALVALVCGVFFCIVSILWSSTRAPHSQSTRYILYIGLSFILLVTGYRYTVFRLQNKHTETTLIAHRDLRQGITDRLAERSHIHPQVQNLMGAMALGYLPHSTNRSELRKSFALSGAAHLLAVSGFHLGVLLWFLSMLAQWIRVRPSYYYFGILISVWLFTALTGWSIPTIRAAQMATFFVVGKLLHRESNTLNLLASSLFLQLVIQPSDLLSWGLWLSYSAVVGIHLFYPIIMNALGSFRSGAIRYLWQSFSLTLAAEMLVLPLSLYLFGFVSWSFIFTTVPLTLLSVPFILLSMVSYLLCWGGAIVLIPERIIDALGMSMLQITRWGSQLDVLVVRCEFPLWALLSLWSIALGLAFLLRSRYRKTSPAS